MLPVERLPGFDAWGGRLETLRTHPGPVWIWGDPGSGVSSFLQWLGAQRNGPVLDDADGGDAGRLAAFLEGEVRATLGAHRDPEAAVPALAPRLLAFRLPSLEEDPRCLAALAAAIGAAEGLTETLPSALWQLPCPGNVAGLRNRILRWKLLGQLPLPAGAADLPALETDDLATNLHALERTLLFRALRLSYGNRVEAARRLGVSRRQLYLLVARHGDPVRGEQPSGPPPKRLSRQNRQNSSRNPGAR